MKHERQSNNDQRHTENLLYSVDFEYYIMRPWLADIDGTVTTESSIVSLCTGP